MVRQRKEGVVENNMWGRENKGIWIGINAMEATIPRAVSKLTGLHDVILQ
jgi:hypothetical protein